MEGWQARKRAQLESDLKVNEAATLAKIERLKTAQEADIAWENTALTTAGWKDEFWTVVLAAPLILCFIPGMDGYVRQGFEAIRDTTPEWYQWMVGVAVSAAFVYRKLADFMALKKGG